MWIFFHWGQNTAFEACGRSMKTFEACGKLTPSRVDTKWLVYYRSRWPEYMAICFHVVAVAWVRPGWVSCHTEWRQNRRIREGDVVCGQRVPWTRGIMVGGMMNEVTHPSILCLHSEVTHCCSGFGLFAYCHSNPRPGWKQPPRWQEFALGGWGVPVSCFL